MKFSLGRAIENATRGETTYRGDVLAFGRIDDGCRLELGRWIGTGVATGMVADGIGVLRDRVVPPHIAGSASRKFDALSAHAGAPYGRANT